MFQIILFEPEIPPNTGNIMRLCANTGAQLHLIKPLGFTLEDKQLIRAGLDYTEWQNIQVHENFSTYLSQQNPKRLFACSTKGQKNYADIVYQPDDALLFGPETRGLPETVLTQFAPDRVLRIPMAPHNRSLNLSNAVAVILYEAWRQQGFIIES